MRLIFYLALSIFISQFAYADPPKGLAMASFRSEIPSIVLSTYLGLDESRITSARDSLLHLLESKNSAQLRLHRNEIDGYLKSMGIPGGVYSHLGKAIFPDKSKVENDLESRDISAYLRFATALNLEIQSEMVLLSYEIDEFEKMSAFMDSSEIFAPKSPSEAFARSLWLSLQDRSNSPPALLPWARQLIDGGYSKDEFVRIVSGEIQKALISGQIRQDTLNLLLASREAHWVEGINAERDGRSHASSPTNKKRSISERVAALLTLRILSGDNSESALKFVNHVVGKRKRIIEIDSWFRDNRVDVKNRTFNEISSGYLDLLRVAERLSGGLNSCNRIFM